MSGKKKYFTDFYVMRTKYWYLTPIFVFYYNKNETYEPGITTPAWSISLKWFNLVIGFQKQEIYDNNSK